MNETARPQLTKIQRALKDLTDAVDAFAVYLDHQENDLIELGRKQREAMMSEWNPSPTFVIVQAIRSGRISCAINNQDPRVGLDKEVWYSILGYSETSAEAYTFIESYKQSIKTNHLANYVCELCYTERTDTSIPIGWYIHFQSLICPCCHKQAELDHLNIPHMKGGYYANGKKDPREK